MWSELKYFLEVFSPNGEHECFQVTLVDEDEKVIAHKVISSVWSQFFNVVFVSARTFGLNFALFSKMKEMLLLFLYQGSQWLQFQGWKILPKSYCSRIQDYLKNQKTSMSIIITFPMLLLLVMMNNNKHIKSFSRTEAYLWRTDSFRNLHQDRDSQKHLQIFKKLSLILKVPMKAI